MFVKAVKIDKGADGLTLFCQLFDDKGEEVMNDFTIPLDANKPDVIQLALDDLATKIRTTALDDLTLTQEYVSKI